MTDYEFVNLGEDNVLPEAITGHPRIGIDTEFVREKTYFSRLCLIQISAGDDIYCADPLELGPPHDVAPSRFWSALMDASWVLHSGRQDVEVLYQSSNLMPSAIFDTQVAAALLGYQPQIGYANLVAELFDVELAKSHTRADWSRRPLPDAFIDYAAEDVVYLLPAQEILSERLEKLGRLSWALEDSADLLNQSLYETRPKFAVDRLKGARNLRGETHSAAVGLATWREHEALRSNRPRQWIMRDAVLIDIATSGAENEDDLGKISGIGGRTVERAGKEILSILQEASHGTSNYEPPPRPNEKQKALLKAMLQKVSARAEELGIAAEIIAPRKELSAAMLGARDSRVFQGWRRALVGEELLSLLDGA